MSRSISVVIKSDTPEIDGKKGYIAAFYPDNGYALVRCGGEEVYAYYDEIEVDSNVATYMISQFRGMFIRGMFNL